MTWGRVSRGSLLVAPRAGGRRRPRRTARSPRPATPATTTGHHSTASTAPTITGPATNHWTTPCTRNTRRTTVVMPISDGGPPSISAYLGSSLPPCSPTARPRMCHASRSPHTATIAATSQRRQPVPSSSAVPTTAAASAISTNPAPQATSTTAALSSCFARTAATPMPSTTASRPARRAMRTGMRYPSLATARRAPSTAWSASPGPRPGSTTVKTTVLPTRATTLRRHWVSPYTVKASRRPTVSSPTRPGRQPRTSSVAALPSPSSVACDPAADLRVVAVVLEHAAGLVRGAELHDALDVVERRSEERVGVRASRGWCPCRGGCGRSAAVRSSRRARPSRSGSGSGWRRRGVRAAAGRPTRARRG